MRVSAGEDRIEGTGHSGGGVYQVQWKRCATISLRSRLRWRFVIAKVASMRAGWNVELVL